MRPFLLAVVLTLASAIAFAQAPLVGTYSEAVSVEVVTVDVVAVDRDGAPVTDLTQADFEVLVDGKPVEITNFSAYFAPVQTVSAPKESAPAATAPRVSPAVEPATFLVYVDLLRTSRFERLLALRELKKFLDTSLRPQDRVLVASYTGSALRVLQPLTSDMRAVKNAIKKLEMRAGPSREFAAVELEGTQGFADDDEAERRLRDALYALRDLVTIVQGIDGRVALLMIGGGYQFDVLPPDAERRVRTIYENVIDRLVATRVTAYTIFSGPERHSQMTSATFAGAEPNVDSDVSTGHTLAAPSEMASFAEETGGIAFVAAHDTAPRLERVRSDLDGYYSLGFRPRLSQGNRMNIDVRVRRPDVRVRHRDAVRLRTDNEAAQDATMAALLADSGMTNPWNVGIRVGDVRRTGRTYRAKIDVHVPVSEIVLSEQNGRHHGRILFTFAIRDPFGNYKQLDGRELPLAMTDEGLATLREKGIHYSLDVELPRGSSELAVTVADATGRGRSTARAPIEVR